MIARFDPTKNKPLALLVVGTLLWAPAALASGSATALEMEIQETELAFMAGRGSYDSVGTVDMRLSSSRLPPPHDLARRVTWMLTKELSERGLELVESGAPIVLQPSVTEFSYKDRGGRGLTRIKGIRVGGGVISAAMTLRIRVLDRATGEELESLEESGKAKSARMDVSGAGAWGSTEGLGDTPVGKAAAQAIEAVVRTLEQRVDGLERRAK